MKAVTQKAAKENIFSEPSLQPVVIVQWYLYVCVPVDWGKQHACMYVLCMLHFSEGFSKTLHSQYSGQMYLKMTYYNRIVSVQDVKVSL